MTRLVLGDHHWLASRRSRPKSDHRRYRAASFRRCTPLASLAARMLFSGPMCGCRRILPGPFGRFAAGTVASAPSPASARTHAAGKHSQQGDLPAPSARGGWVGKSPRPHGSGFTPQRVVSLGVEATRSRRSSSPLSVLERIAGAERSPRTFRLRPIQVAALQWR